MKKFVETDDEMDEEYDFSKSERAPYAALAGDVHIVALDEDVWASFPDSDAVNAALRAVMKASRAEVPEALQQAS